MWSITEACFFFSSGLERVMDLIPAISSSLPPPRAWIVSSRLMVREYYTRADSQAVISRYVATGGLVYTLEIII